MIKKFLFCLILMLGIGIMRGADGDWKLHTTYDEEVYRLFEAPDRLYILALGQMHNPDNPYYIVYKERKAQLFVHDKSSGETIGYTMRNYLSSPMINTAAYNPFDGYLCITYSDGNIDLLYDDDRVVNIPALKNANMAESKLVNSITFGLDDHKIYMATDFGFAVIDPSSGRLEKARNFHKKMVAIAKTGNKLVVSDGTAIYTGNAANALMSLTDLTALQNSAVKLLLPMTDNRILVSASDAVNVRKVNDDNSITTESQVVGDLSYSSYSANKQGYILSETWCMIQISYDGARRDQGAAIAAPYYNQFITSRDGKTYYVNGGRDGIHRFERTGDNWGATWTKTATLSRPNAPAAFLCASMTYSDKYGLLVTNQSHNRLFDSQVRIASQISGLKDGVWTNYGYCYTRPSYGRSHDLPRGIVQDRNNPDLFYLGSRWDGLQVMNLADTMQIVTAGREDIPAATLPGFVNINGITFSTPRYDYYGNLWVYNEKDKSNNCDLGVWPASALKSGDMSKVIWIAMGSQPAPYGEVFPLRAYNNRNLVIASHTNSPSSFVIYDHNGTLDNTSDDRTQNIVDLINQDGGSISQDYIYNMWEDEETGTVWVATSNGVFTFQPWKMFDNPKQARRIKVSRNDGTNLADYLLDGIDVRAITTDGNGNKWFATLGAGVVQTSSDGTYVMRQLTTDNSYLPNNNTFQLCYNKAANSMMIATFDGLAEYFVPGASSGQGFDAVKAYPNPVRPDFVGYITIEGLMDNSLVKIVDSDGNLVKELGVPYSGIARWDGTNLTGAKVNSGVYFVFMSRSGENASEANVAKILVVK